MARYYDGGTIPWVKSGELRETIITDTEEHVTEEAINETGIKVVPAGALLLAMYGATIGRLGMLGVPATTNQAVCHIVPDPNLADVRYLFHALSAQVPSLVGRGMGGAQPNISQTLVKGLAVSLPPLDEQRRIAEVLDRAESLLAHRRAAIAHLDALTQSIFLDMFGDPGTNPMEWPLKEIAGLCASVNDIRCGPFGTQLNKSAFRRDGVPLWGIKHVNRSFETPTSEFLDAGTASRLSLYSLEPKDIVMTRKGTVGNCAVYPAHAPRGIMHSDLLRIRLDRRSCDPDFLSHQLHHSSSVARQLVAMSGGAVMPGINVGRLKALKVLVPPLHLQVRFAASLASIDALRALHRHGLEKLDTLFASLQHRAFRGEL